jgi:hypothetical protein
MSNYRIEFNMGVKFYSRIDCIEVTDTPLCDIKDGFWINQDLKFTKGADARYWIPPHAILYIAKDAERQS